mmetsp:Transcript_30522/g.73148  ORF Transcript_30522/g.73148 Transcript_30522/m.73148 type:complete len:254 (-) Transcript_30522:117-878(-)
MSLSTKEMLSKSTWHSASSSGFWALSTSSHEGASPSSGDAGSGVGSSPGPAGVGSFVGAAAEGPERPPTRVASMLASGTSVSNISELESDCSTGGLDGASLELVAPLPVAVSSCVDLLVESSLSLSSVTATSTKGIFLGVQKVLYSTSANGNATTKAANISVISTTLRPLTSSSTRTTGAWACSVNSLNSSRGHNAVGEGVFTAGGGGNTIRTARVTSCWSVGIGHVTMPSPAKDAERTSKLSTDCGFRNTHS